MDERPYPDGIDALWLASDHVGHLGVFVTGGSGPIPVQALEPDYPLADLETHLLALPKASDIELRVRLPQPDRFVALAERGLFLFDWSDVHRTEAYIDEYELIAQPYRPLMLGQLPNGLLDAARSIRFTGIAFAHAWRINVGAHMACRVAPA